MNVTPRNSAFHPLSVLLALLCVVAISTLPAPAQNAQGTILGHITDSSGAAVVGADVTLRNLGTSLTQKAKTNSVGDYVFVNITPGSYNVVVQAPGFKQTEAPNLRVNVEATLRQDFQLQLGAVSEQVTVESRAEMVQSDNATMGNVVPGKMIDELPISGRDFTNLLRLQAGATQVQGSSQLYWAQHGLNNDFASVSINGARTESVSYLIDGVSANDQYFSTANNIPNSGAIEEFKVQNGLYSAEYGQGSAQVNVALRSGTNQFHGSLYDYLQNDAFQPRSPLNAWENAVNGVPLQPKDTLKQNQYGFTFGGPLTIPKIYDGKNRTFFFYSYEAGRRRKSSVARALVPTAAERSGDFSDWRDSAGNIVPIYDPRTQVGGDPSTRQAFSGNQIDPSRFPAIAVNYMNIYPLPNVNIANMADCAQSNGNGGSAGCANYIASLSQPYDTDNNTFRVDENLNANNRIFVTGILGEQTFLNPSAMPFTGEIKYQNNWLFGVNWQHTFTPNLFNELRVGYNWMVWRNGSDSLNGTNFGTQLGFANVPGNPILWGVPDVQLRGFQELGNTNSGWVQKENNYELVENLKWIHGRHAFTVGADIRRYMLNMVSAFGAMGQIGFNGAYTGLDPNLTNSGAYTTPGAGSSVADFLLGDPISVTGPAPGGSDYFDVRATNWNFFFQDDFRVTPRLTLNLGLRYELPPAFHDIHNSGAQLDLSNGGGFLWANKDTVAQIQAQPGFIPSLARCCVDNKLVPVDRWNLAPRFGLAWRPFATDRFVVRAGYGLFYDLQNLWYSLTTYDNISVYTGASAFYPTSSGATSQAPTTVDTLWKPSPMDFSFFTLPYYIPFAQVNWPGNRSPYTQQWTLDTEYALGRNTLVDVAYVGSRSLHQPGYWYYNAGRMTGVDVACNQYRTVDEAQGADPSCVGDPNFVPVLDRARFPNISSHAYAVANIFGSNYNALQTRLTQRFARGLQYQLNYTFSRTLDEVSAINNIPTGSFTLQNNNCPACDYGPASYDQTHRFVASGSYELPIGRGRGLSLGPANWLLGGWEFSGIYTAASGFPETLFAGFGGFGQDGVRADLRRPDQVGNPNAPVYGTLDPAVYSQALFKSDIFHWFNPAAYAAPAGNQYGSVSRNSIRQPYFMRGDITFAKNFHFTERQNLQYRLEIFNVFSLWHSKVDGGIQGNLASTNFGSLVPIDTFQTGPSAGQPLPESLQSGLRNWWTPRTIQMVLRYSF